MADQILTEQEHHKKAFEAYYAQGAKRSYQRVASEVGASASTVKLWSRSFGWAQRIHDRDGQIAREAADRALRTGIDRGERNLKLVEGTLSHLAKSIREGRIKGQIGDVDRFIRLEEYLLNPGGRDDLRLNPGVRRQLSEILAETDMAKLRASLIQIIQHLCEVDPSLRETLRQWLGLAATDQPKGQGTEKTAKTVPETVPPDSSG